MKSKKILALFAAGMISFATSANAAYNLTLCGASPGGLWSMLGAGVDAAAVSYTHLTLRTTPYV